MRKFISFHCQIRGTLIYILYIIALVGRIESMKLKCGLNSIFTFSPIFWSFLLLDTISKVGSSLLLDSYIKTNEKTYFTETNQKSSAKDNKFASKRLFLIIITIISDLAFIFHIFILLYNPYLEFIFKVVISYIISLIMLKNKIYICQIICVSVILLLSIVREYFDGFYFGKTFFILVFGSILMSSISENLTSFVCCYEGNMPKYWMLLQGCFQFTLCAVYLIFVPSSFSTLIDVLALSDFRGIISLFCFLVASLIYYICDALILKQNPNPAFKVIPNTLGIGFYYILDILTYREYKTNKNKIIVTGLVLIIFLIISLLFNGIIQFDCCEYSNIEIANNVGLIEKDTETTTENSN